MAAGGHHTLEIRNGELWAWGSNANGELGDGTTTQRTTAVKIGSASNWELIAAGVNHSVALRADGTLWAWGDNQYGQLGDGTNIDKTSPVQIGSATDWVSISAGEGHTIALKANGTLWAWGLNDNGQLGDATTVNKNVPVQIGSATDWQSISTRSNHSLAIKANGRLWAWGLNFNGQLGNGTTVLSTTPIQVGTDSAWVTVSAGTNFSTALKANGTAWAWGQNNSGQLGNGSNTQSTVPVQFGSGNLWTWISAGGYHVLALKANGTLWGCGSNSTGGQLGLSGGDRSTPSQVGTNNTWVNTAAGEYYSLGLRANGSLWGCGSNNNGQLGDGTTVNKNTFFQINTLTTSLISINTSGVSSACIKSDGTLWTWGDNSYGELGNETFNIGLNPNQVGTATNWISVSMSKENFLAIKADGTLWACGSNEFGQFGNGATSTSPQAIPVQIGTATDWVSVASCSYYSFGLKSDGTLWAWGSNDNAQLGIGNMINQLSPVQIGSATDWVSVSMGASFHGVALKANGTAWTWGSNLIGQLGIGNNTTSTVPVKVNTAGSIIAIGAYIYNTALLKSDGTLWICGSNFEGTIGDGTTINRSLPVQVGTSKWISVFLGSYNTTGTQPNGSLWAWGNNGNGQLGIGNTTNQLTPTQVTSQSNVVSHSGYENNLIISAQRNNYCGAGYNSTASLGLGNTVNTNVYLCTTGVCTKPVVSSVTASANNFCPGNSATLSVTGNLYDGSYWEWYNDMCSGNIIGTGSSIIVSPNTTTTYYVRGAGGCATTSTCGSITITVHPLPTPVITGPVSICPGTTATLGLNTTYNSYLWSTGAVSSTITANPLTLYIVTVTDVNGCSSQTGTTILTYPSPSVPTISASGPTTFCQGGNVNLSVGSYSYYSWLPGGATTASVNVSPSATTTYTVTVSTINLCTATNTKTITVNPLPNTGTTVSSSSICVGSNTSITATGANTYSWQPGNLSGNSIIVLPSQTTTYTVTGTNTSSACTKTTTRTITVKPLPPVPQITANGSLNVCTGNSVQLTASSSLNNNLVFDGVNDYVEDNSVILNPALGFTIEGRLKINAQGSHSLATQTLNNIPAPFDIYTNGSGGLQFFVGNGGYYAYVITPGGLIDTGIWYHIACVYNPAGGGTMTIYINGVPQASGAVNGPVGNASGSNFRIGTRSDFFSFTNGQIDEVRIWNSPLSQPAIAASMNTNVPSNSASLLAYYKMEEGNGNTTRNEVTMLSSATLLNGPAWLINYPSPFGYYSNYLWNPGGSTGNTITATSSNTYTVTATGINGCNSHASISVVVAPCSSTLNLKLFLEGYYSGSGAMLPALFNQGVGMSNTISDSIDVTLHHAITLAQIATVRTLLNINGTATCTFPVSSGDYYISVRHRNALETWSANPVTISAISTYDFTTAANKAYGNNQIQIEPNIWAFYSGDLNSDENIDLLDASELETDINNFAFGYFASDLNGDGNVDLLDSPVLEDNINNFIFSNHP